jgi:hypothetical protein
MQILETKIEEKEREVRKPVLFYQAYIVPIFAKQRNRKVSFVAEIYETERRKDS